MPVARLLASDFGNPFIGLYCACNDKLALLGPSVSPKFEDACKKALGVEVHQATVSGSNLLGLFCTMNSNGIIVPEQVEKQELKHFKELGLEVHVLRGRLNACGNLIAANDKGAVAHPLIEKADLGKISDCLGVEVVPIAIAGYATTGACCIATNKGFAAHNRASEEELQLLESALKVKGTIATANMGVSFLRPCVVANSHGYVAGAKTSGFETSRLDEGLGFY
jgi:translation initiation factor 6